MHNSGNGWMEYEHFIEVLSELFKSKAQRSFYSSTPIVYSADDRDVGSKRAWGSHLSVSYAREAVKSMVPMYEDQGEHTFG